MQAIVLATRNSGKISELTALLQDFSLEVIGLDRYPELGDIPETGDTFQENALIKARTVCRHTGLVAVADDSGLEVDALDGAPGILSARYSATETEPATPQRNNQKLLNELENFPCERRTARFRCIMAAAAPNGEELVAEGVWEGGVAFDLKGSGGFGYDPLFYDPELQCHAGEMPPEIKNARSHRGKAMRKLLENWPAFWTRANRPST